MACLLGRTHMCVTGFAEWLAGIGGVVSRHRGVRLRRGGVVRAGIGEYACAGMGAYVCALSPLCTSYPHNAVSRLLDQ